MSLQMKRYAEKITRLQMEQLEGFRHRAEQWRNGLGAVTALVFTATIVKNPQDIAALSDGARTLVTSFVGVGMAALVTGSLLGMSAAFGAPGHHMILTPESLMEWESREISRGNKAIRRAQAALIFGLVCLAVATGLAWNDQEQSSLIAVDVGGDEPLCGPLMPSGDDGLTIVIEDKSGVQTVVLPWPTILRLAQTAVCEAP